MTRILLMSSNQTFKANYPSELVEELLQSLTIAFVVPSEEPLPETLGALTVSEGLLGRC